MTQDTSTHRKKTLFIPVLGALVVLLIAIVAPYLVDTVSAAEAPKDPDTSEDPGWFCCFSIIVPLAAALVSLMLFRARMHHERRK
jgi:hypothetical protein